jgi:PiT family inorganic phosphate transporter
VVLSRRPLLAAPAETSLDPWLFEVPVAIWIGAALALYMAWAIGANDVANAMGTSVGSGALTIFHAILVAGLLEFLGAYLVGGHVTNTVRKGLLDMNIVAESPELLLYGMLAALASSATLLLVATKFGLPISTTHSIVGAIVGFGAVGLGPAAVDWGRVGQVAGSWVTSPILGGVLAFVVFNLIRWLVLDREDPARQLQKVGPYFFFYVFFVIGAVTLFKGLKNLNLDLEFAPAMVAATCLGLVGAGFGAVILRRVGRQTEHDPRQRFSKVERVFVVLQILTACAVAFAHGSNDVANAIGPLAAVLTVAQGMEVTGKSAVQPWMLAVGGVGIVVGLATWGYRVMETVGKKITALTPSRGFAAELAAATVIAFASRMGIPVSTTHILVGSVLGVGLARGIGALDLRVVGSILVSWALTLPLAAGLSIFFYFFFKGLLTP